MLQRQVSTHHVCFTDCILHQMHSGLLCHVVPCLVRCGVLTPCRLLPADCCRRGVIGYIRDGEEGHIAADSEAAKQPVCVPLGVSHAFWNAAADTDLHVDVSMLAAMSPDCDGSARPLVS